ncbi:MAG: efflux RND transporter permease subunit [Bdellovibrionota bacterium]
MNLAELSIKRPVFIVCVVLLTLVLGLASFSKLPVDLFPDVSFPAVFIRVTYPGASPMDMEKQVSKPLEDELGSLAGLKTITSNNLESTSVIVLEFKLGTDIKDLEQQIRNRVGNARSKLPEDVEDPIIRRFDPADQAVITLAVLSKLPEGQMYDVVNEQIKPLIERVNNVGQVDIVGGRKREIQVIVNKRALEDRQVSMLQIGKRIQETSKDVPIGKVENATDEVVMRAVGEFESLEDLKQVSINFMGSDRAVRLSEIAEIKEGLEDQKYISTIKGSPVMFIQVYKQSGTNTVAVVDEVNNTVSKVNDYLKSKNIEANVITLRDSSTPIRLNVADVKETILLGILLCIIVVFFFLGSLRSTFITGLALPNSLIGGFVLMYAFGFSINIMTLLALSLAVGLLIDDAIVVRENIFRHMQMGKSPIRAAIEGTKEVTQAVIATTLVVIAVFGPIAFVQGMIGQFFRQFGLTVVFTMIISIFDAFTVAPMLSAYLASNTEHKKSKGWFGRMLQSFDRFQEKLENVYERALRFTLGHRKTILGGAFVIFIVCMALVKFIPKTFLPPNDIGEFAITYELPAGTSLTASGEFAKKLEALVESEKFVDIFSTTVGTTNGESNKGNMYIKLVERKQRSMNTTEAKEFFREKVTKFKSEAIVAVTDIDISGGGQKPMNLYLTGEDLGVLTKYADELRARIEKLPDLADVDTNFRAGKPEFHVVFDRDRSEALGVSTTSAGAELRYRTEGYQPAVFRENGIEYNIRLRFQEGARDLRENFNSTFVPNMNFNMIPLNRIAKGEVAQGYSQINRQNKSRFIAITANMSAKGNLGNATVGIENIMKNEFPPPVGVDYAFKGQAEDFKDLIGNMIMAMALGVLFIYLVLASLYESFVTPFTILLALPLAISGAMLGLFITGKGIDIFSLIGLVMLLGVVAKNSILLVDYTHHLLLEGMERNKAIITACRTRLRPILMTSFALIAGTLPIAIGLTELGAQRSSMGVAIIGGVAVSTFLTLLVVPAAFGFIDDFRIWSIRIASKVRGEQPSGATSRADEVAMAAHK